MSENKNYIDNKLLEKELIYLSETFKKDAERIMKKKKINKKDAEKQAKGIISEDLGEMFLGIANNLANKSNFNNYTYKEEMIGLGLEYLCRFAKRYDYTNANANAFSYCTQICYNGFIQCIKKENDRAKMKDKMIKESMHETEQEKWEKSKSEYRHEEMP